MEVNPVLWLDLMQHLDAPFLVFVLCSLAVSVSFLLCSYSKYKSKTLFHGPPFPTRLGFLVCFHTIYILHAFLLRTPQNLFKSLHIPLMTPVERIRALLLEGSKGEALS